MSILDIRAAMLKNGYHPVPLPPGSNRCVLKRWQELATSDNDALWQDAPAGANIGSFCGPDIITVDFDADEEKPDGVSVFDWLSKEHPEALLGAIVEKTKSNGRHVTFRGSLPAKTYALFTLDGADVEVEIKAANNYTACPPSKTKDGAYEYLSQRTHLNTPIKYLPELPGIFVEAIKRYEVEEGAGAKAELENLKQPEGGKPRGPGDELDDRDLEVCAEHYLNVFLGGATKGHRHNRGVAYARLLFGLGLSRSEARHWIESYASHVGREMPRREIDDIISYGDQHPDRDVRIPWRAVWEDREKRDPKKYAKPVLKDEKGNAVVITPEKIKAVEEKKQAELDELLQRAQELEKQQRADRIESEQRREAKAKEIDPTFGVPVQEVRDSAIKFLEEKSYNVQALDILKKGDPIDFIMKQYHRMHVGDDNHGRLLLVSVGCQSVLNSDGTHPGTSGDTGKGKTDSCQAMAHLMPPEYVIAASISPKALFYKKGVLQGTIIFLDDLQNIDETLEGIIKRATSTYQQGAELETVDIKRQHEAKHLPSRCTWWLTSINGDYDTQILNRQLNLTVDESTEQDQKVVERALKLAEAGESNRPEDEPIMICREIIRTLKNSSPVTVAIPYAKRLEWHNPENRRNLPMFLDTIRAFAAIRQFQRERDKEGRVLANLIDYEAARLLWQSIARGQISKLTKREMALIQAIKDLDGEADNDSLQKKLNIGRTGILNLMNGKKDKGGLLSKVPELKIKDMTFTEKTTDGSEGERKNIYTLPINYDILKNFNSIVSLKEEKSNVTTSP